MLKNIFLQVLNVFFGVFSDLWPQLRPLWEPHYPHGGLKWQPGHLQYNIKGVVYVFCRVRTQLRKKIRMFLVGGTQMGYSIREKGVLSASFASNIHINPGSMPQHVHSLCKHAAQCRHFRIFLPFRFYMKSVRGESKNVKNRILDTFRGQYILILVIFHNFSMLNFTKIKIQSL